MPNKKIPKQTFGIRHLMTWIQQGISLALLLLKLIEKMQNF